MSTKESTSKKLAVLASHTHTSLKQGLGMVFPTRLRRTLQYVDNYLLSSTAGSVATQQWKVNSMFDPDLTGTGHQPRGFDQLCSTTGPYVKYRVLAVRISGEAVSTNDATLTLINGFSDLSTIPAIAGGGIGSISGTSELPGWTALFIPPTGAPVARFAQAARIAEIESVTESAVLSEDNYSATSVADPADLAYFTCKMQAENGGTAAANLMVRFEFDVQFEEPILLAAS